MKLKGGVKMECGEGGHHCNEGVWGMRSSL